MIYLELFWSFLKIGLFSFGGGYAAIPLIEDIIVHQNDWLSVVEFTDLITISQMTPGPISVNSATFVGLNIAGIGGAFFATLGNLMPSFLIVTFIAWLYMRYRNIDSLQNVLKVLQPAVIAMIAAAGVSLMITAFWGLSSISISTTSVKAVIIFILSLVLIIKYGVKPIKVMILSGVLNLFWTLLTQLILG
ncbi:MAG: chromate transporter [Atopostipes suicloacalis]|nr:chromate transporter [Atopostipes suicloacalis]